MGTEVAVAVPFRGGCPHRERAWRWLQAAYAERYPDWEVVEGSTGDGPWCKAEAVNDAIDRCGADVVVMADADVWTEGLEAAVGAVEDGAGWAVPHRDVHRLDEASTAAVLRGADWRGQEGLTQPPYEGFLGGGIVVARRDVLCDVPLDGRFIGWGQEDEAHALALNALYGKPWRGTADLVHLYHPPQPRDGRRRGSAESWALRERYAAAGKDPAAMRALLEETKCQLPA